MLSWKKPQIAFDLLNLQKCFFLISANSCQNISFELIFKERIMIHEITTVILPKIYHLHEQKQWSSKNYLKKRIFVRNRIKKRKKNVHNFWSTILVIFKKLFFSFCPLLTRLETSGVHRNFCLFKTFKTISMSGAI